MQCSNFVSRLRVTPNNLSSSSTPRSPFGELAEIGSESEPGPISCMFMRMFPTICLHNVCIEMPQLLEIYASDAASQN